jgi:hypothetical protein
MWGVGGDHKKERAHHVRLMEEEPVNVSRQDIDLTIQKETKGPSPDDAKTECD